MSIKRTISGCICGLFLICIGCGDSSDQCKEMLENLKNKIETNNPGLNSPTRSYNVDHFDQIQKMQSEGCELDGSYLGFSPLLCNSGSPKCPPNYSCTAGNSCTYP